MGQAGRIREIFKEMIALENSNCMRQPTARDRDIVCTDPRKWAQARKPDEPTPPEKDFAGEVLLRIRRRYSARLFPSCAVSPILQELLSTKVRLGCLFHTGDSAGTAMEGASTALELAPARRGSAKSRTRRRQTSVFPVDYAAGVATGRIDCWDLGPEDHEFSG